MARAPGEELRGRTQRTSVPAGVGGGPARRSAGGEARSAVSELVGAHAAILARPEFRVEEEDPRILFRIGEETWLARRAGGRMALEPWSPGGAEPDLVATLTEEGFRGHVLGELDLFGTPGHGVRFRPVSGRFPDSALRRLATRILSALALSSQGVERFRGSHVERLYLSDRSEREDGGSEPMHGWSLPFYGGRILHDLVISKRPERTLEVGMAHALSTIFIASAMAENGGGHHLAIDPWQGTGFGRAGTRNVRQAGLERFVEVIEQPDYVALPKLLEAGAGRFQLAFIDGLHIFDHVLLDFFYCDLLLAEGGHLVFDDSTLPAVRAALDFVAQNRSDSYERVPEHCLGRITVLRKVAGDARVEDYGTVFHRPFASGGEELVPLPPPRGSRALKRAFDLTLASLASLVLLPLGLAIALAILLEDLLVGERPTSPFQRLPRFSGRERFEAIRFRTFRPSRGPTVRSSVGSVVEALHLGGLPLLLGVLRGRLSLVGPRPIGPDEFVRFEVYRDSGVRPGLVGPQHTPEGAGGHGSEYYQDFVSRSQLSLLLLDLSIVGRALRHMADGLGPRGRWRVRGTSPRL